MWSCVCPSFRFCIWICMDVDGSPSVVCHGQRINTAGYRFLYCTQRCGVVTTQALFCQICSQTTVLLISRKWFHSQLRFLGRTSKVKTSFTGILGKFAWRNGMTKWTRRALWISNVKFIASFLTLISFKQISKFSARLTCTGSEDSIKFLKLAGCHKKLCIVFFGVEINENRFWSGSPSPIFSQHLEHFSGFPEFIGVSKRQRVGLNAWFWFHPDGSASFIEVFSATYKGNQACTQKQDVVLMKSVWFALFWINVALRHRWESINFPSWIAGCMAFQVYFEERCSL